jgi:hypothetical protein
MDLPTFFTDFDARITPTATQKTAAQEGHTTLRERLEGDPILTNLVEVTFLQGSYRRSTAVRPKPDGNLDVDVIVVTNIDSAITSPAAAIEKFIPFVEKYYPGKYRRQGRSIGISLADVDLDLVVTAKPDQQTTDVLRKSAALGYGSIDSPEWSEGVMKLLASGEWRGGSLLIPDREAGKWEPTHPLAQIEATVNKNKQCNGYLLRVVRAAKWRNRWSRDDRAPKSFPLERIVGEYCPAGITSVAQGMVSYYEAALAQLRPYAERNEVPFLPDYGAADHNVLARCTPVEIKDFVSDLSKAAPLARSAYDEADKARSADLWHDLLGDEFPRSPGGDGDKKGFTERTAVTVPATARFAAE